MDAIESLGLGHLNVVGLTLDPGRADDNSVIIRADLPDPLFSMLVGPPTVAYLAGIRDRPHRGFAPRSSSVAGRVVGPPDDRE